jgi:hypothetical protein
MNFKITFEITDKELAKALLPVGGKIVDVEIDEAKRRRRQPATKTTAPKQTASSRKTAK